jgi:hypothetical protein
VSEGSPENLKMPKPAWPVVLPRTLLACLLVAAVLAGCAGSSTSSAPGAPSAIPPGQPPTGENAGSAAAHAAPTRSEGAVSVRNENGKVVASKTVTLTNDFGGAAQSSVHLKTVAGGVDARSWSEGGYKVVVVLESRGTTESIARSRLDLLKVVHDDRLSAGALALSTEAKFPADSCTPTGDCLSAGVTASLPEPPSYTLDLTTTSGGADIAGLGGPSATAHTSSGGVAITGAFQRITAQASSGGIDLEGLANSVDAHTTSGGVAAKLRATATGTWTLSTGSGGVDVVVERGSGQGIDADATADAGGVHIDLAGAHAVGAQTRTQAHQQTDGFADAAVQTTIHASADSGGVDVSQG